MEMNLFSKKILERDCSVSRNLKRLPQRKPFHGYDKNSEKTFSAKKPFHGHQKIMQRLKPIKQTAKGILLMTGISLFPCTPPGVPTSRPPGLLVSHVRARDH